MQMSGRSSECVTVRLCCCYFKTLDVAESSRRGLRASYTWTCVRTLRRGRAHEAAHAPAQIKQTIPPRSMNVLNCCKCLSLERSQFLLIETINNRSEGEQDKATRANTTGKPKKKKTRICWASGLRTVKVRRWDNFQSLCISFILVLQHFWHNTNAQEENLPYTSFFQGQTIL